MQAYFVLSQTSPHCGMNMRQDVFFLDINVAFVAVLVSGRGGVGFSEEEEEDLTADCSFLLRNPWKSYAYTIY